jgi:hypothetical protein
MYEILLTRIFSVTMWYHFAFVAISVALFGMTVGALIVYLAPDRFPAEKTNERLIQSSLLFSITIVLSFLMQLWVPFVPKWTLAGVYSSGCLYLETSIPFIFSGICVCLALTRFPRQISKLYAADLVGAAVGAAALVWLLDRIDAPSAVIAIAALPSVASFWFAQAGRQAGFDKLLAATRHFRTWGDCYGYALVATGRADIMIDPVLETWDAAPLLPVISEAGGRFTDLAGQPTIYGHSGLATNGTLHEQVLAMVNS